MLKSPRTFKGGYKFKNYLGQPQDKLVTAEIPAQVLVPLRHGFSLPVKPLVKKGDKVFAGQIIGRDDDNISSPVHSPVTGIVEEIKKLNYFLREVNMLSIRTTDFSPEIQRLPGHTKKWEKLSQDKIEELIYLSGVSSLDNEGIPTHFKSSVITGEQVRDIIVHGVGSEPYNISQDLLLSDENLANFIEGIKILKKIMPKAKIHLAMASHKKYLIERLSQSSAELDWLDIYPLEPKFPQGYDEMLVPTILKRKFPYTYSAANMGVVVLNIQAVLAVYEAVVEGKPLIERIVALCGPCFKENLHLKVRIGTSLNEIVANRLKTSMPARIILNSLLKGFELKDRHLPISRSLSQLIAITENKNREFLAFTRPGVRRDSYSRSFFSKWLPGIKKLPDTNQHGEERVCISCGYCSDACPVHLIPHLISKYVQIDIVDETIMNYGIFNCVDCGLCSFVCPSKIPLLEHIKKGREKLIEEGCGPDQCILPHFELTGIEEYRGVKKL